MAESTLVCLAKSVLNHLSSPAFKEFHLVPNLNKDLQRLEEDIEFVAGCINDAEQKGSKSASVKAWLSRLRTVLYDADDMFDAIAARTLHKKVMTGNTLEKEVCLFFSKSNQLRFIIKTAYDVKAIRQRLDEVAGDIDLFDFLRGPIGENPERRSIYRPETYSYIREEDVIGRDQEKEDVINLLLSPDYDRGEKTCHRILPVVSIVGFGGLGKTTLAKLVFNDERVLREFDRRLWVCINYFSDLKEVLLLMIQSVEWDKHGIIGSSLNELLQKFRESIEGRRYLLVLDDVWEEDVLNWERLKVLLPWGCRSSRILITTRSTKVAKCSDAIKPYYQLNVLSEKSALILFKRRAFRMDELDKYPELVSLGCEIVRKCGYVPLTLLLIGSTLRFEEKDKEIWLSFVNNKLPEMLSDGIDDRSIMNALKLSYNNLSPGLKQCFAYCSLFPKGYTFDKDELVRMWLAQGFLEPRHGRMLEEVGDDYFFSLVDKSFFHDVKSYIMRNSCLGYKFKIHSLLHDLSIQVAGRENRCFFKEDLEEMNDESNLRHISISNPNFLFDYSSLPSLSKTLRTLLFHNTQQFKPEIMSLFLARFRMLRTLQLSHLNLDNLPNSIGQLIHLRYLDLSYNWNLETLPNSVCNLYHLQTLKLEGCVSLKELPSNIGMLVSLRHLLLDDCNSIASLPSGLTALSSLVTLDRLVVHHFNGGLRYLNGLDNLCGVLTVELPVGGWPNCISDATVSNMSRKHMLNGLNISWIRSEADSTAHVMDKDNAQEVLNALKPHNSIEYLNIDGYVGDALSSWVFMLPNVQELVLTNCSFKYLDYRVRMSDNYLRLKTLKMYSLTRLKGWRDVEAHNDQISKMPCLPHVSKVVIQKCPELTESVPSFLGIEHLHLLGVNEKLVEVLLTENAYCSALSSASSSKCQYNSELKELQLHRVNGLRCLPYGWITHLTTLKTLSITGCKQLDWVSRAGLAHLTALETLSIFGCGIVNLEDEDDRKLEDDLGMPWKALQRLCDLTVPWQRHLQEGLTYLTALERLKINYWKSDQVEMDNIEIEGREKFWKGLKRLGHVKVSFGDQRISCFPTWIQYLSFLKEVEFCDCEELSLSWMTLIKMKLHKLDFMKVKKVTTVGEKVVEQQNQLSLLEELYISECEKEEWIHNIPWKLFPSLQILSLNSISNLKSIPNEIQHLTSLRQLIIGDCSANLKNRCTRNGADWPLISCIPDVDIRASGSDETSEIQGGV